MSVLLLVALALFLAVASPGDAQQTSGGGYFAIGTVELKVDALNGPLVDAGFPEISSSAISLGGGGHGVRGRVLVGGEGHGFITSVETTEDGATGLRFGGGYGLFNLGWEVFHRDRLTIFPKAGFGGGGYILQIGPRDVPLFQDVLENPNRGVSLSHGGLLISLGIRTELALGERPARNQPRRGAVLGLEVSALRGIGNWEWNTEWGEVTRGPELPFDGIHLRVTIGGGRGGR